MEATSEVNIAFDDFKFWGRGMTNLLFFNLKIRDQLFLKIGEAC